MEESTRGRIAAGVRVSIGLLSVGLLAYSAGYTRAFIVESDVRITAAREIINLPGLPGWTGIFAFAGMGLFFLFLLLTVTEFGQHKRD